VLPRHPDDVTSTELEVPSYLPANAPVAYRLAHIRHKLPSPRLVAEHIRMAAALAPQLESLPPETPVAGEVADMFLMLMTQSLGWKPGSGSSDPWVKILAERGLSRPIRYGSSWPLGQLREILVAAVVTAGLDPSQLSGSLCDILAKAVLTQESAVAALEQEEHTLVDQMLRERAAAITAPAFAQGESSSV
jgi:hypothetical protein